MNMETSEMFWIGVGDLHDHVGNLERIPDLAKAKGVILSGDLTTRGREAQGERVVRAVMEHNPVVYAQIGNMDGPEVDHWLSEQGMNIHVRALELAPGVAMMGVGASTPTPFNTPSEYPDSQLKDWLDQAHAQVGEYRNLLLVAHNPPINTAADRIGPGNHVGSRAVREFIERVRPDVCLTGHIHESQCLDTLGPTQVINPGMLAQGGYAVIRLRDGKLTAELRRV